MSDQRKGDTEVEIEQPWTASWDSVAEALDVDPEIGLSEDEVARRRERYGRNRLREAESKSAWAILIEQFQSLIIALLAVASVLSFIFGDWIEGLAIVVVIILNTAIGFFTEFQAIRSMEALQELSRVDAQVRRDGQVQEVSAESIVPGDVLLLSGGDVVTADVRLIEASKLQADESALTGESVPVAKQTEPVDEDRPLAERASMAYKGTAVTRGTGEGIVLATGQETELGKISSLVQEAEEEVTPLEERLDQLGRKLLWVTLGIALLVAVSGVIAGRDITLMIETSIALAIASVPEGLPIVATVALARGMWRMAKRQALINQLAAVETLGATSVILTDKTGTLTENRMTVVQLSLPGEVIHISGEGLDLHGGFTRGEDESADPEEDSQLRAILRTGVLCNNAALQALDETDDMETVGDPLEVALLVAGAKADMQRPDLLDSMPEVREVAFEANTKMMATYHETDNEGYRVAVKGALDAVLEACDRMSTQDGTEPLDDDDRDRWMARNQELAADGLRVIAMATKTVDDPDVDPYERLTFLGLAALLDPPREEIGDAIAACHKAGMRVVMVTGDQPETARKVAYAVDLVPDEDARAVYGQDLEDVSELDSEQRQDILDTPIFARVTPKQKLDLIAAHQDAGAIVAMTGDGVNDAPALKKADIGVAMGMRGTQVAKEAADMILKDDAFGTIVAAVEQGRAIFENIRNFVLYLLSCNVAEILVVGLASVINAPLPIKPLQILFLNLVTDVFPALALGVGEGDAHIMQRPPRDPEEAIITRKHWAQIGGYSMLITIAVLVTLGIALTQLGMQQQRAITLSFLTLAFAQLWHVFNMRDPDAGLIRNDVTQNPYIWGALVLSIGMVLMVVYVPFLANLLKLSRPGLSGWGLVLGLSLLPLIIGQAISEIRQVFRSS